jgi:ABC-type phosphate/phosphonate transport system permease subunit
MILQSLWRRGQQQWRDGCCSHGRLHQRAQKPALDRKSDVKFCGIFFYFTRFFCSDKLPKVRPRSSSLPALMSEFRGLFWGSLPDNTSEQPVHDARASVWIAHFYVHNDLRAVRMCLVITLFSAVITNPLTWLLSTNLVVSPWPTLLIVQKEEHLD